MGSDVKPGIVASLALGIILLCFALTVDFPKASGGGFKGDEATYYVLGHSLARDHDFKYERKDLVRVWEEYPGPEGIFLKRGKVVDIQKSDSFPFIRWAKLEDPSGDRELYFSKSYIYPLVAAPFIAFFGTNGFLVLHALLMALNLLVAYLFAYARTQSNRIALPLAAGFIGASLIPVYFVWLTPELFNFSLSLYALFLWLYKDARPVADGNRRSFLHGSGSDVAAAILIGLVTFSKPSHLLLLAPLAGEAVLRRQWKRAAVATVIAGGVTAALFAANAAITGEFNYQGGHRQTFYHHTGFPFANSWETFDNIGPVRGREDLMVGDVLVNSHSLEVFGHNLVYFTLGRNCGVVPYFFPGVVVLASFLASRGRQRWQWLLVATIAVTVLVHLFVWPFTYNGAGGPVGSRYFLPFYSLFLFLLPAGAGLPAAAAGLAGGALFTSTIVLNPFHASINPGEHTESGALRWLPIELTLLNDLPVAQKPDRFKRPLNGTPPTLAYFLDGNAYSPEEIPSGSGQWWFWVKGHATADIVLRAPVAEAGGKRWVSKTISRLNLQIRNSGVDNVVTVKTGAEQRTLSLTPGELQNFSMAVASGVPYRRDVQPTSYVYTLSVSTARGFVPFLEIPCERKGSCADDSRYLGAMISVIPEYTDADISIWSVPPAQTTPGKEDVGGIRDAP